MDDVDWQLDAELDEALNSTDESQATDSASEHYSRADEQDVPSSKCIEEVESAEAHEVAARDTVRHEGNSHNLNAKDIPQPRQDQHLQDACMEIHPRFQFPDSVTLSPSSTTTTYFPSPPHEPSYAQSPFSPVKSWEHTHTSPTRLLSPSSSTDGPSTSYHHPAKSPTDVHAPRRRRLVRRSQPRPGTDTSSNPPAPRAPHSSLPTDLPPPPDSSAFRVTSLPIEILQRICSFLPASELTNLAAACTAFRAVAENEGLWSQLYTARWGQDEQARGSHPHNPWRLAYLDRDRTDLHQILRTTPPEHRPIYINMHQANRQHTLRAVSSSDAAAALTAPPPMNNRAQRIADQIAAWKGARGLPQGEVPRPPTGGRSRRYHVIGGTAYCCEESGWVHHCGEGCTERFVDRDTGLWVCPISGHTWDHIVTQEGETYGRGQEEGEEGDAAGRDMELGGYEWDGSSHNPYCGWLWQQEALGGWGVRQQVLNEARGLGAGSALRKKKQKRANDSE